MNFASRHPPRGKFLRGHLRAPLAGLCGWLVLTLAGATAASAQLFTRVAPRDSTDWKLLEVRGPVTWSTEVVTQAHSGKDPIWLFRCNARPRMTQQHVRLLLRLDSLGIAPPQRKDAEFWTWTWHVGNMETADYVHLALLDEFGNEISLGASHLLFDNRMRRFAPPTDFLDAWTTITDALGFAKRGGEAGPDSVGRIVGVILTMAMPYRQDVWLGALQFGPSGQHPPPAEEAPQDVVTSRGRALFVDLDRDGRAEMLAPWQEGAKVYRYRPDHARYELQERHDMLGRLRPFNLMVAGDLDGDGDVDLVALDLNEDTIWRLENQVDGFHGEPITVPRPEVEARAQALALADDDGDGWPELFVAYHLVTNSAVARIFRLPGLSGGRFGAPRGLPSSHAWGNYWGSYFLAPVDLNGDGLLDLVSAAGGMDLVAFPGAGQGAYGDPVRLLWLPRLGFFRDVTFVDPNGDGRPDLYVSLWEDSGLPNRTNRSFFGVNQGEFQFREVAVPYGIQGGLRTHDSCIGEVDGRPGPELVVLEETRVIAYDLAELGRMLREGRVGAVPGRVLTDDAHDLAGAYRICVQDLDGDGSAELLLARSKGPLILPLRDATPVRTLAWAGWGHHGVASGARISSQVEPGWSLSLLATNRTGPEPLVIQATEGASMTLPGGGRQALPPAAAGTVQRIDPGAREDRPRLTRMKEWAQWHLPVLLEYPAAAARSGNFRFGSLSIAFAAAGFLGWQSHRRYRRRTAERNWRQLLERIGMTTHNRWRQPLATATILLRDVALRPDGSTPPGEDPLSEIVKGFPVEVLQTLREAMEVASDLNVEGSQTGSRALQTLATLHEPGSRDWGRLHEAARQLESRLLIVQETLAERFCCDAGATIRRLLDFRVAVLNGIRASFDVVDPQLERRFPMASDDLFLVVDELVLNATKKRPPPGSITMRIKPDGLKAIQLIVHDDGGPLQVEAAGPEGAGSRSGHSRIRGVLSAYHGTLRLENAPQGGVNAIARLPRMDLR